MRASFASAAAWMLAGIASAKPNSIAAAEVRSLRAGTDHLPVKQLLSGSDLWMPLSSGDDRASIALPRFATVFRRDVRPGCAIAMSAGRRREETAARAEAGRYVPANTAAWRARNATR